MRMTAECFLAQKATLAAALSPLLDSVGRRASREACMPWSGGPPRDRARAAAAHLLRPQRLWRVQSRLHTCTCCCVKRASWALR